MVEVFVYNADGALVTQRNAKSIPEARRLALGMQSILPPDYSVKVYKEIDF